MIKKLLESERGSLNHFFENLDGARLEKALEILVACEGLIILSGVGKSGLVAEKISMTLTSTGSRSLFLAPTNALHGDIGIASEKDVFILLSKSGESDELLNLIPFLRNKKIKIIAIVANGASRLAKAVDFALVIPHDKELCPYDLAPTTSTVSQMIVGDVLAVALMEKKFITLDQFAQNHPAGRIGRRIVTRVKDLMIKGAEIPLCKPSDKLVDSLVELSNKRCGCVLVIDEERTLLGIFTDGDLRRSLQRQGSQALELTLKELMTREPRWIFENELAWDALHLMEADQKHPIMVLAVLDADKRVAGVIKMHDIIQAGL